ncbi:MAG: class I SAM-dependent methyltransferase [Patescibacteria group bacterium]|nr:class I SAM-dependent methyltransferase [Patescibacteria group bacterium]MDD5715426.1 class I SAM-dependent methyltransferase [Patescibacteria group bacterium]
MLDTLQRYIPVVKAIREVADYRRQEVLEVGGGVLGGIGELMPECKFINYDFIESGSTLPNVTNVRSRGTNLQYPDNFFNISICVDAIEHIEKPADKKAMIGELIRVTKKRIILAVPCGREGWKMVKRFGDYYYGHHVEKLEMLDQHLKYGHPDRDEIIHYIKSTAGGDSLRIQIKKNANIRIWYYLITMQFRFPRFFAHKTMKSFTFFNPLFSLFNSGVPLRYIFIIDKA